MKLNEASCGGSSWWQPRLRAAHFALVAILACATLAGAAQPAPSDALPGDQQPLPPDPRPVLDQAGPALGAADPTAASDDMEVLTRGPVHEAFAETVSLNPQPGPVVPKAAPEAIEELPPDQKPEGDNVAWIPGYWSWDDERRDFLWVSGIWRALPPGRQWVPGYWRDARGGQQWVSGYWADAQASEVEYLPQPPATLEVGPSTVAISNNQTWIPGTWIWNVSRYVWQPGYWIQPQPNWVWVPASYVWAPGGYIFVNGYWDYEPNARGVLFAPVYFNRGVVARPGFFYSPLAAINLSIFSNHLFCRPGFNHYYFGDYYAPNYLAGGFYPWFSAGRNRGYDPIWAHQRWTHRNDRDFVRTVESGYRDRRDHVEQRPPSTWHDKAMFGKGPQGKPGGRPQGPQLGMTLEQVANTKDTPHKFQTLDKDARQHLATRDKEQMQQMRDQRKKVESQTVGRDPRRPTKMVLPKSHIAAKPIAEAGQENAPPSVPAGAKVHATGPQYTNRGDRRPGQPAIPATDKQPTIEQPGGGVNKQPQNPAARRRFGVPPSAGQPAPGQTLPGQPSTGPPTQGDPAKGDPAKRPGTFNRKVSPPSSGESKPNEQPKPPGNPNRPGRQFKPQTSNRLPLDAGAAGVPGGAPSQSKSLQQPTNVNPGNSINPGNNGPRSQPSFDPRRSRGNVNPTPGNMSPGNLGQQGNSGQQGAVVQPSGANNFNRQAPSQRQFTARGGGQPPAATSAPKPQVQPQTQAPSQPDAKPGSADGGGRRKFQDRNR